VLFPLTIDIHGFILSLKLLPLTYNDQLSI